jgi:ABC-2 type transport system permease protein
VKARALTAQTRVEAMLTVRRGESLLVTFGIPLGVLVFFNAVHVIPTGFRDPIDFLVPGVLALAVMSTAMVSLGIATGFERRYGVLKRLGSTPLGRGPLITAKITTVVVIELVQAATIVGIGIALGWSPSVRLLPAAAVMLLGTVAFAGLGLLMAGTLRAELTLAAANGLYLVLLLFGGMAFPLSKLPAALATAARGLPAAALGDALRDVLVHGRVSGGALTVLAIWAVTMPLLAARLFTWEEP